MTDILTRIRRLFKRKKPTLQERYPQHEIGRHTYGGLRVIDLGEGKKLRVGAFCSIANGVKVFLGGEHRVDWVTTFPFPVLWKDDAGSFEGHPHSKGDVTIGNDVWIGLETVIMSGVHIGDGAVIGARSVVSRDVPPYAIAAGNPARIIRMRFEPQQIDRLLALAWWDKDIDQIKAWLPELLSDDIDGFLCRAEGHAHAIQPTGK
jgi:acetyltransferase-like isoleucine patch superfamily enzyme